MIFSPLKQVTDVAVSEDGNLIQFRIENAGSESLNLGFQPHDLTKFIEDLIGLAARASAIRTNDEPVPLGVSPPTIFSTNAITATGIAESADRKSMFLILRLGDVDLTFQFERTILQILADDLSLASKTLSAEEGVRH
jgi:hypothetical protein